MELDEFKAARDTGRALQAQSLMENELLKEAFDKLEAEYVGAWKQTRHEDELGREKLFLAVNVVGKVRQHLETILANGRLAETQLYQLALRRKRS